VVAGGGGGRAVAGARGGGGGGGGVGTRGGGGGGGGWGGYRSRTTPKRHTAQAPKQHKAASNPPRAWQAVSKLHPTWHGAWRALSKLRATWQAASNKARAPSLVASNLEWVLHAQVCCCSFLPAFRVRVAVIVWGPCLVGCCIQVVPDVGPWWFGAFQAASNPPKARQARNKLHPTWHDPWQALSKLHPTWHGARATLDAAC